MDKIKDYFDRYPNSDEVFENGGRLFHNSGAADSFAQTETKRYSRVEMEKSAPASSENAETPVETVNAPASSENAETPVETADAPASSENAEIPVETADATVPAETPTTKTKSK